MAIKIFYAHLREEKKIDAMIHWKDTTDKEHSQFYREL